MGKIIETRIEYKKIDLDDIKSAVAMPYIIQTFIDLDAEIIVTQKKNMTTNQVCVVTQIRYREKGMLNPPKESGSTHAFASKDKRVIAGTSYIRAFPAEQHEKTAFEAIREHERICKKIVKDDSTKRLTA